MALPKLALTKIKGLLAEVPEYETTPEFMNKKFEELLENDKYLDDEVEKRVTNDELTEFSKVVNTSISEKVKVNDEQQDINIKTENDKVKSIQVGEKIYTMPSSEYAFEINGEGDLCVNYRDGSNPPDFKINDSGELIFNI